MQIKLFLDGEKKTISVPFVKARMLRRALEISEQFQDAEDAEQENRKFSLEDIDVMVDFVVELFNNQFTVDDVWDGLSNEELMTELYRCIAECMPKQKTPDPNVRSRSHKNAPRR